MENLLMQLCIYSVLKYSVCIGYVKLILLEPGYCRKVLMDQIF